MIRIATTQQAQSIDTESQRQFSLSSTTLMNTAGRKSFEKIEQIFPDKLLTIVILCGPGNNGGDGVVVFRELLKAGYKNVRCFLAVSPKSSSLVEQTESVKQKIPTLSDKVELPQADLYIDALFGIGLNQDISSTLKKYVEAINTSRDSGASQTISLDIPSGLCSNTGIIKGCAIEADHTITFGIYKLGQWIQEGPRVCGKLHIVDIGFPKELVAKIANTHFVFTQKDFLKHFPKRTSTSNKSNYGHVKIWAGSTGMWGAAILCAKAAYRTGAGYVSIESDEPYFTDLPEVLVEKKSAIDKKFTYAVGPGWGSEGDREKRLRELSQHSIPNVVLDADAINLIAHATTAFTIPKDWILTPHTKELSRLLKNKDTVSIENDRSAAVEKAAKDTGAVVLLKGYRTLIAHENKVFVIPRGNSALAKAGSGDVLTGIISGIRAQNISAPLAALLGAYLHGLMSDIWLSKNHANTLTPTDLLKGLPIILKKLSK